MSEKPPLTRAIPNSRPGILSFVYGVYALLAFLPILLSAIFGASLIPGLDRRRRWVSAVSGVYFRIAGLPVQVTGLQNLPDGRCVVVANHTSHLDGVALQAFLPPRFSFVIKGEMRNVPGVHFLLRRIGSRFVERFVATASVRDARKLIRASSNGESFAFFPEGTFVAEAGLGKFRPGAFATAIKGGLPIIPVVICGARRILPAGSILPRRDNLNIEILRLIPPTDAAFDSSRELSAEARRRMLQVLDESELHTPGPG
jgi:1-acyl-sn-glycerol-3-phosphate acyltransferase